MGESIVSNQTLILCTMKQKGGYTEKIHQTLLAWWGVFSMNQDSEGFSTDCEKEKTLSGSILALIALSLSGTVSPK